MLALAERGDARCHFLAEAGKGLGGSGVGIGGIERIGVVDNTGRLLQGDQLLSIFARDLLSRQKGATIIADVKASQTLFDDIAAHGGNPVMWKTGHSLIKSKMKALHAPLAGEMSGHIFFEENYGFDDGLFAALKLLTILSQQHSSLSSMIDTLPAAFSTPEIRVEVEEERKFAIIDAVQDYLKKDTSKQYEISTIDGLRVKLNNGWWVLRASNTQAALVARCEAASAHHLHEIETELRSLLAIHHVSW
jgi:phosphomannomutase